MKNFQYFMPILFLYFTTQVKAQISNAINFQEQWESGILYVTATPNAILLLDSNQNLYSTLPELNQLIQDWDIIDFTRAFPSSQVLTNVYKMQCNCNEDSLLQVVYDLPQYYTIPEKVSIPQLLFTPNDYTLTFNPDWALDIINAEEAWDISTGDPNVIIGITDDGYDFNHPELVGAYVSYFTALQANHGTVVAITAAGNTNNGIGKSSIGFDCKMSFHNYGNVNYALEAANAGAKVVNMSWTNGCTFSPYNQTIINEIHNLGVLLVAAAGNGSTCGGPANLVYPAAYDNVIAVSSIDASDSHQDPPGDPSATHQHNSSVDLVAPGYHVPCASMNYGYITANGTSFAAPIVSGTAGLILSENPSFTPDEVEQILKCTADDIYSIGNNSLYNGLLGAGRLNAAEALKMARNFTSPIIVTSSSCDQVGAATITLPYDDGNYTYVWSNGVTGNIISGLISETFIGLTPIYEDYTVTVNHQCGFTKTFDIEIEYIPGISLTETHINTLGCEGNGSIDLTVSGGSSPYTYAWNQAATTEDLSGLSSGLYEVLVSDNNNCEESLNVFILFPSAIQATATTVNTTCPEGNGTIDLTVSGGTAPYTYTWNQGSTSEDLSDLTADFYEVGVTDVNNCLTSFNLFIVPDESIYDYPNGLTITLPGYQLVDAFPQDGIIRFRGPLIIKSGVNYSINNKTLEFARDLLPEIPDQGATHSGVIVEHKAKLTATNCTFKGVSSCDAMWQGIQVWGDDHYKTTIGAPVQPLRHGELVLTNSIVRDAHIGIALYRVNVPYSISALDHGRGILKAKFSTFLNNRISVDFKGRSLVTNSSYIKECNFTCNEPMVDPLIYNGEGSEVFIRLSKVKNPVFNGNTFNGNLAFAIDQRATGIRSYDAGYVVQSGNAGAVNPSSPPVPNIFTNLSQGIDVYSTGGAVSTIRIKDNRFNNVYQGITASGSNFDEISYNFFTTPMGNVAFNSWGMFLNTSSGFLATENTMNTLGTNQYTFGIVNKNVNYIMSEVYKNRFNGDYNAATQVEGNINDELQIDCNRYLGTNTFDWAILSGTMADQGICDPDVTLQVKNIFAPCSTSDQSQIYSISSPAFIYSSENAFMPSCVSPVANLNLNPCLTTSSFEESCPQLVTGPCPSCVVALGQQVDFLPPGLVRKKVKGEYVRRLAQEGEVQDLIDFLVNESDTKDRKVLIPTHLQRKEFIEARNELNLIDQSTFENQKYYELFDVLTLIGETERVLDDITLSEKQIVETIAFSNTEVSIQAQAVLAELNKGAYIRFPEQVMLSPSAMMINNNNNNQDESVTEKATNVHVYPNPSKGDVVVEFEKASQSKGELLDAMGRLILTFELDENQRTYVLNSLSQGVYTLVIHYLEGNIETKRVIIE